MMKRIFLYVMSAVLLLNLIACQVATPNTVETTQTVEETGTEIEIGTEKEIETEAKTEPSTAERDTDGTIEETEPGTEEQTEKVEWMAAPDVYYTLDEFVTQWHQRDINIQQDNGIQNIETELTMMVPILKCPDFKLFAIEVLEDQYFFYYQPVDVDEPWVDHDTNIIVSISFENGPTFDAVARQHGFSPEGRTSIYAPSRNVWLLDIDDNIDGNVMGIWFPRSIELWTEEELYRYFSFEMRTFTGTLAEEK